MVPGSRNGSLTAEIVVVTAVEERAARRAFPRHASVTRVAPGAAGWSPRRASRLVISVGLCGACAAELEPGTVVVANGVLDGRGMLRPLPAGPAAAAISAAQGLGLTARTGSMVDIGAIVHGADRITWSRRGALAADMESGTLAAASERAQIPLIVIRGVLDTRDHELSPLWTRPVTALLRPGLWPQAVWLARWAPRVAKRAARVAAATMREVGGGDL